MEIIWGSLMKEETYECENCGKTTKVSDKKAPECCGKRMKKLSLDICTQPAHAEHARPMDPENACDNGRAG
jgi:hypothetical protein